MEGFIWVLPDIREGLRFDDCMVSFLLDIACMLLGLVLSMGGRKALGGCVVAAVGLACGWGGVLISRLFPTNLVMKLVFFTMFCFLGVCLAYFLDTMWKVFAKKLRFCGWLGDHFGWLTAFLGAGLTAAVLWKKVYRSILWDAVCFGLLSVWGLIWQIRHKGLRRYTYTYDDLCRMTREDEAGA